ncbi:Conserved_hypothetical protein [Hexamita inflata]|uniref:Uncharacterized protein n=1 Tax=Hexamita inflata TaxID=28002 RepID=A0AA86UNK1_9EUKA|nr:Conserved hypothetical protein [Hexamita inflata]CAI9958331.1 Conserved hypothetical protein [Hexamita inflata]
MAYKIYYNDWRPGHGFQRYISMDVPADQTEIYVTVYGDVQKICTDQINNIVGMHEVAKVHNISKFRSLTISSTYVVFTHPINRRCYLYDTNEIGDDKSMEITPDLNGYLLDISLSSELLDYEFYFKQCEKRVYMNMISPKGIMQTEINDVIFPVYNKQLYEYGSSYGDFLFPLVYVNSQFKGDTGLYSTPTNTINGKNDVIDIVKSVLFGREISNEMEYVLAGNDSRFENVTISGKCVQFYANSPRNIEYPIKSGIIHSLQSVSRATGSGSKVYTQYYGPKVCVDDFVYMPAFFLTEEDPAMKSICDRLPGIQANFTQHVKAGTWEYLDSIDKSPTNPDNKKAIAYTQSMVDKLQTTCQKAYFLPTYLQNLAATVAIVAIFFLAILILTVLISIFLTKRNSLNKYFGKVAPKERKRLLIEILVALGIIVFLIIIIIALQQYTIQILLILIIFAVSLIIYGYNHYFRTQLLEISDAVQASDDKFIYHVSTILIQFVISVIVDSLEILLTITDILQMLQYMKFQYYQNRITNISWLMNPANKILEAAQALGKGVYPFIFLVVSLINQELMKSDWFKKLIRKPDHALDMPNFLLKKLLKLFGYFQGFTYNVFFAFTDNSLNVTAFKSKNVNSNLEVIIKMFLAGTLYSISKYNLLLEYYEQINKAVIKVFIALAQIQANIFTIAAAPIRLSWNLVTGRWKELSDSFKILLLAQASIVYYLIMLPLDPIITVLTPTTLMLQDFMFPCPFLLQIFGIVDHQNVLAKQTSILLARDAPSIIRRVFVSVQAGAVAIFFSLLFTQDQNATINPAEQWHCFIFAGAMLLTSLVSTNQIGNIIAKQQFKFTNKVLQLQCALSQSQSRMYESLIKIHCNYEHESPMYEDFLRGFIFAGYGNIPGCGPLLSCIAKFLGATCLASNGIWKFDVEIVLNILQFIFIVFTVFWALKIDNETMYFLGWFCAYMILQLSQNWKDVIEEFNEDLTLTSLVEKLVRKIFQKGRKSTLQTQNESEHSNFALNAENKIVHNDSVLVPSIETKKGENGIENVL